jgi:hypothetical protein
VLIKLSEGWFKATNSVVQLPGASAYRTLRRLRMRDEPPKRSEGHGQLCSGQVGLFLCQQAGV